MTNRFLFLIFFVPASIFGGAALTYGFAVCESMTDAEVLALPKSHFCAAGKIKRE